MKTFLVTLLLLVPALSQAAPIIRVRTEAQPETKVALEVSTTAPDDANDAQATAEWAKKELESAVEQNPGLKPEIIVANGPATSGDATHELASKIAGHHATVTTQTIPQDSIELAKSRFKDWFHRHYRVTFTLVRGVANSSVVTWGLVISADIPFASALPVGLVAGGMSAGFQYFNEAYSSWMLHAKTTFGRYTRNYAAQVAYMSLVKLTSGLVGIPSEGHIVSSISNVFLTSLYTTLAQGPWSMSIGESARIELEKHPEKARRIRFYRDLKILAVSMVSTGISVANLLGVPLSEAALVGLAATGSIYYVKTLIKARRWKSEQDKTLACEAMMKL